MQGEFKGDYGKFVEVWYRGTERLLNGRPPDLRGRLVGDTDRFVRLEEVPNRNDPLYIHKDDIGLLIPNSQLGKDDIDCIKKIAGE